MDFPVQVTTRGWRRNTFFRAWLTGITDRRPFPSYLVVLHEHGMNETNVCERPADGYATPDREGRIWCYGWIGPQVEALKTVEALSESDV